MFYCCLALGKNCISLMQTHLPWTGCGTATAQHESQATHASCWSLSELFFPLLTHKPCSSQDYCTPYLEPRLLTFKVTFRTLLGSMFTPSPHPAPAAPAATCKSYVFPDLQSTGNPPPRQDTTTEPTHGHRLYTRELLRASQQALSLCFLHIIFFLHSV